MKTLQGNVKEAQWRCMYINIIYLNMILWLNKSKIEHERQVKDELQGSFEVKVKVEVKSSNSTCTLTVASTHFDISTNLEIKY